MYAGIEIGGTKVIVACGSSPETLSAPRRIATAAPDATLAGAVAAIRDLAGPQPLQGIGIASFGPVGVTPHGRGFGQILRTPKPGWSGVDVLGIFRRAFPDVPVAIDTDVNAAALGEQAWGGGRGLADLAYVTAGTGIGVGLLVDGRPVHGALHPEAGHIRVRREAGDDFAGLCPFHGDCLEGLASGPTLLARTGMPGEDLPAGHPVWSRIGGYLAQLYYSLTLTTAPQRILVGGGLGLRADVLDASRRHLFELLGGYIEALSSVDGIARYLAPADLGDRAGVLGAIRLAQTAG